MARSRSSKRQSRALNTMQEKGMGLCALGIAFLVIPKFMGSSPILNAVATGLRIPGWLALAAGLALLGIHRFTKATRVRHQNRKFSVFRVTAPMESMSYAAVK